MWIIYTLARPPDEPHFVGVIGPDDSGDKIETADETLSIYGTTETQEDALKHQAELFERYNVKPPTTPVKRIPVQCVSNGVTYRSANAACHAHNIDKRAMSTHLNKPDVFKHVKGLVFKRIEQ